MISSAESCGVKNPFYNEDISIKKEETNNINRNTFKRFFYQHSKLIRLIFIVFISLFTFGISFAAISSETIYDWVDNDGEYEFIDFPVRQSALRYYQAYFDVISIKDENDLMDYYDDFYEQSSEIDSIYEDSSLLSSRDYTKAFSKLNIVGLIMAGELNLDQPFTSTIEYFIVVILLFIIQIFPLIILSLAV